MIARLLKLGSDIRKFFIGIFGTFSCSDLERVFFILKQIGVLIVDDSIFMRKIITDILNQDAQIKILGEAKNGIDGVEKCMSLRPQVVTMDVQMPIMDGLQALEQIMLKRPTPVIVLSSVTTEGADETLKAFDLGAFDVLSKPPSRTDAKLQDFTRDLIERVKAAAVANRFQLAKKYFSSISEHKLASGTSPSIHKKIEKNSTYNEVNISKALPKYPIELVLIGTSTGGPPALQAVLTQLPYDFPVPIIVDQHMPSGFTAPLAQRFDSSCGLKVQEGADRDILKAGNVYIAPAGKQTQVQRIAGRLALKITTESPIETHYKPSLDVTLLSMAREVGKGVLGVVMTGMGTDGLLGIREIKARGGFAIAESEETCVVYGMPRALIEAGLADRIIPLGDIARNIVECVQRR